MRAGFLSRPRVDEGFDWIPGGVRQVVDPLRRVSPRFLSEARRLNQEEMTSGFRAGKAGHPCPESASRSWWHGWRNGMIAAGHAPEDSASRALWQQQCKARDLRWFFDVWEVGSDVVRH